jgi:hypothetical protein
MYCGGQPPDRSGGTPGYMDADKQDGHLPEKGVGDCTGNLQIGRAWSAWRGASL